MFDETEAAKILFLNENTQLKFFESDAPFYSKLSLCDNGHEVSDCSFTPEEKKMIKHGMDNYDLLINTLNQINTRAKSKSLSAFIHLIEDYRKAKILTSKGL